MPKMFARVFLCSLYGLAFAGNSTSHCKALPGEPGWPSSDTWDALNKTVGGQLLAVKPPGAVCQRSWPEYDPLACVTVAGQWTNTSYHYKSISVDYNDDTCFPDPSSPCSARGYPAYFIQATCAEDVQQGVNFARQHNVRLSIKGTGHDQPGRSSGAESLAILTSEIRGDGMKVVNYPKEKLTGGAVTAVRVWAGDRDVDLYTFGSKNNYTLVAGSDMHPGVNVWLSGGHGPVSARYGLASDQILEMDVVTADGQVRTIDSEREPDLFWAMRGGGGGTFAVLISMKVQGFPQISTPIREFAFNTTTNSSTFWNILSYYASNAPKLIDAGVFGYFYGVTTTPSVSGYGTVSQLTGTLLAPGMTSEKMLEILRPVEQHILTTNWSDKIEHSMNISNHPSFSTFWLTNPPEAAGGDSRLGSRLLDAPALSNETAIKETFIASDPAPSEFIGHMVIGPGTHNVSKARVGSTLPAWRKSYVHLVQVTYWTRGNATEKKEENAKLRNKMAPAFKKLAPDTGAYRNEADPTDPDWQQDFHGENYPKLLAMKKKYDAEGVFWCKSCVGSELYDIDVLEGDADGVGQSVVRLCKK